MITFAGLNIGVIYHIKELIKDNFSIESQWKKMHAKPSFTLIMCPYAYVYSMWFNNSAGEDFYEFESTNNIITSWNIYYEKARGNMVRIEDLYTMDGQMQFIMDMAKRHSLKLDSYENRILWYGRKIDVIKDELDSEQVKYITSLIDRKIASGYKYRIR